MALFDHYAGLYDLEYAGWDDDWQMVEGLARRTGSPILEIGCGTGRLLLPLAASGYRVTGVDNSEEMLQLARQKAAARGLSDRVSLARQDMRALDLGQRYNMAFAAINTFLHMMTLDDQLAALTSIRRHLTPDGLLLLDLFNPHPDRLLDCRGQVVFDRVLVEPETSHTWTKFQAQTVDLGEQTIQTTLFLDRIIGDGQVERRQFAYCLRYIYRAELELLLYRAGFQIEALYGSYELDRFTGESDKIIAIARTADLSWDA